MGGISHRRGRVDTDADDGQSWGSVGVGGRSNGRGRVDLDVDQGQGWRTMGVHRVFDGSGGSHGFMVGSVENYIVGGGDHVHLAKGVNGLRRNMLTLTNQQLGRLWVGQQCITKHKTISSGTHSFIIIYKQLT